MTDEQRAREPELLARELLAAEHTACGATTSAAAIKNNVVHWRDQLALRAIVKALTPTPAEAGSGEIELVARQLLAAEFERSDRPMWATMIRDGHWRLQGNGVANVAFRAICTALSRSTVTRDGVLEEARFLCERLREFENVLLDDEVAREFFGHVQPPLARLEAELKS